MSGQLSFVNNLPALTHLEHSKLSFMYALVLLLTSPRDIYGMPLDNIIHSTMYELVLEYKTSMHTMVLVIYEFVLSNTTACKLWIVLTLLVLLDSI